VTPLRLDRSGVTPLRWRADGRTDGRSAAGAGLPAPEPQRGAVSSPPDQTEARGREAHQTRA
jgi:hypothetical protein